MKISWGTGITIFYVLFVAGIILFVVKSTQQNNELVVDNYYDEAVGYQNNIDALSNAMNAESRLKMDYRVHESAIAINTEGKKTNIPGTLTFYRPDNASSDFKIDFVTDTSGNASIALKNMKRGHWKVGLSWKSGGKDCLETSNMFFQNP